MDHRSLSIKEIKYVGEKNTFLFRLHEDEVESPRIASGPR